MGVVLLQRHPVVVFMVEASQVRFENFEFVGTLGWKSTQFLIAALVDLLGASSTEIAWRH
jgi:hypothetical protein